MATTLISVEEYFRFKNGRLDNVDMIFLRELAIPFADILAELD